MKKIQEIELPNDCWFKSGAHSNTTHIMDTIVQIIKQNPKQSPEGKKEMKEIYNEIEELQKELLENPPRDDFNRGYFAGLSKALAIINQRTNILNKRIKDK